MPSILSPSSSLSSAPPPSPTTAALTAPHTLSDNRPPAGLVEALTSTAIAGYAIDPDTHSPIKIRYTIDDGAPVTVTANATPAAPFNGHGFNITLPQLSAGDHTITVDAIDPAGLQLVTLA